ncbi:MAG: hypothetical protein AAF594_15115, partial [Bacteroidota bacterium]
MSPDILRDLAVGNPSCAVQVSTERLLCWGPNESGQIGDSTREARARATRVTSVGVPLRRPRVSRFGERGFACAPGDDGVLRCWGAGERGQLGDGRRRDRTIPTPVRALELEGEEPLPLDADSVALGAAHACARLVGGPGLVCWGANDRGQLGDGTFTDREVPTRVRLPGLAPDGTPVQAGDGVPPVDVLSVAAGRAHTCAVVTRPGDGLAQAGVLCWGENGLGQLGDGSPGPPERAPRFVRGLETEGELTAAATFLPLALGQDHGCAAVPWREGLGALGADTELWCWGAAAEQQTGLAGGALPSPEAVRVALPDGVGVVGTPSLGRAHGCVQLVDLEVAEGAFDAGGTRFGCWGANDLGQLGDGSTLASRRPQR